jgi:predicted nicotinamide N-methyase
VIDRESARALIARETAVVSPPLCPELRLRLVTEACRLWRATESDLAALGLEAPYWAFAWAGGQALARFVLDRPEIVRGRDVLDFGSGSGVVAIAAALAGARSVIAADVDPIAAEAARLNAALNGVSIAVTGGDLTAAPDPGGRAFGVILAGDVAYDRAQADRFLARLRAEAGRGADVLVGDPNRGFIAGDDLVPVAELDAPADVDTAGIMTKRTVIYRLSKTRGLPRGPTPAGNGAP